MSSLLASLYNTNRSPNSRSSSMFTKHFQFSAFDNKNNDQKIRPASISKPIKHDFSDKNNLVKWTPLIKTVHKLGAKIKKQYFFFWCRTQAMIKAKQSQKVLKDQQNNISIQVENHKQLQNLSCQPSQSIQNEVKKLNQQKEISENKYIQSEKLILKEKNNSTKRQEKIIQNIPQHICLNDQSFSKISQATTIRKSPYILKSKDIIIQQLISNLSSIQSKFSENYLKVLAFNHIKKKSDKIYALNIITHVKVKEHYNILMIESLRKIKSVSTQVVKFQFFVNLLQNIKISRITNAFKNIRKEQFLHLSVKMQQFQKIKDTKQLQVEQQISKTYNFMKFKKNKTLQQKSQQILSNNIILQQHVKQSQSQSKQKSTQILRQQKPICINQAPSICLNLRLKISKTKPITLIKEDKHIELNEFGKKSERERVKKLSHLYNQQPIFEIPDISDITLFNSTINNQLFLNKQKEEIHIQKEQENNFNSKQEIEDFWGRPIFQKQTEQNKSQKQMKYNSIQLHTSPKFQRYEVNTSQVKINKSSSCANIALVRKSSTNGNKTPISSKRCIEIFPKKSSLSNLYKSTSRNYDTVNSNCKSPVLKQWSCMGSCQLSKQKENKSIMTPNKKSTNKTKNLEEKQCLDGKVSSSHDFRKQKTQLKQNQRKIEVEQSRKTSKILGVKKFNNQLNSNQKKYIKANQQSDNTKKIFNIQQKSNNRISNKQNILSQTSSKKIKKQKKFKQKECSQFCTIDPFHVKLKGIHSQNNLYSFANKSSTQRLKEKRTILQQIDHKQQNSPIFQHIEMTQQNCYQSQQLLKQFQENKNGTSVQLMKEPFRPSTQQKSKKLRSKLDKIELNTARKMKLQIQNMINQRKKTSIGILKFG